MAGRLKVGTMRDTPHLLRHAWEVFVVFLRLGLTSFGGPVAHLGYFRTEFVQRRQWLTDGAYADLVALCQFLPGPTSSQVGMAIGMERAGHLGAWAAWAGFTLPSALALTLLALGIGHGDGIPPGVVQGLKLAAVAVVAQAAWGMGQTLCPDVWRRALAAGAAATVLWWPTPWSQVLVMLAGAALGWLRPTPAGPEVAQPDTHSTRQGALWLLLWVALLLGLPMLSRLLASPVLETVDTFFRAGSLVFGGGHVVLPLLQAELVPTGQVDANAFLAGYGAAQAIPGPLFSFAAFLGASMQHGINGWTGAAIALVALFAPAFLLVAGALPFWTRLRRWAGPRAALQGINAAVVGLLLATLVHPVGTSALHRPEDVGLAVFAVLALTLGRLPPWLVVGACALLGGLLQAVA